MQESEEKKEQTLKKEQEAQQLAHYQKMMQSFAAMKLIDFGPKVKKSPISKYSKENIKELFEKLDEPKNQRSLREISRYLYFASSHYRSVINYYSTLYNFDYVVEPHNTIPVNINKDKYAKAFYKAVNNYETIDIKSESIKIRAHVYIDGVFYGFARQSKNGVFIQHLDPDNCQISFINTETGSYGYSFDFSIFRNNEDLLDNYPTEFFNIYTFLKESKTKTWWAKIDSVNAICIKPTIGLVTVPPLVGLFEGILDIYDYKRLAKGREEMGNYQLLFQKIPIRTDKDASPNHFLLEESFVKIFHNNIAENLAENIGLATSPMDLQAIKFDIEKSDTSKVAEATSQLWNEAGISELLFGNSTSSTGLKMSITADESALINVVRDFEKWINEYGKVNFKNTYNFKCRILNVTKFNQQEYLDSRIKVAQLGFGVKAEISAIMGMTPSALYMNAFLENEVLKLPEKFIPLQSSYTQSGDQGDKNGRPSNADGNLSESGEKNRENDSNEND